MFCAPGVPPKWQQHGTEREMSTIAMVSGAPEEIRTPDPQNLVWCSIQNQALLRRSERARRARGRMMAKRGSGKRTIWPKKPIPAIPRAGPFRNRSMAMVDPTARRRSASARLDQTERDRASVAGAIVTLAVGGGPTHRAAFFNSAAGHRPRPVGAPSCGSGFCPSAG